MSNNKDSVMHQVQLIQAQVFAAIEEANAGVPSERRVTPGSALTAVKRSLNATRHLPFEVREFQAMRELSSFINLVQKNTFSDTFTNHTDLLPIAHPASTRVHGLTASALVEARLRWVLSDTRISEQARPLLASVFTASSDSVEYKYAMTRLTNLPAGSYPLEALVAAFGDGNSALARRARAMLQRRDRKGRFAFQGGGMSALVERVNGMVQRLTGRVVSQSEDGNNVRIQLPNGRLVDVPVDGGEFIKAILGKNKDGFSGVEAKHKVGDIIINEEDLQYFDAPHGFRKDTSYTGPGVKFTDDEYDVVKNGKDFVATRRDNGQPVGNADNWADVQKMIYDDEPVADAEAGREPIARLDQEQIDRMYDPNFDPKEILTPAGADLGKGTEADVSAIPGEFEYNYPDGAYQLPQDVKHVSGFNDPVNGSTDYTDDPTELAQKFEADALVNALREALLPTQASKANGEGNLKFNKKEPVAAEAIYLALQEKGVDAKQEVAKIYDAANGDKKNQEALARLEGEPAPKAVNAPKAVTPEITVPSLKGTNLTDGKGEVTWISADELDRAARDSAVERGQIGMRPATRGEYRPVNPNNPDDIAAAKKATEAAPDGPFPVGFVRAGDMSPKLKGWSKVSAAPSSELEEQPTKPPVAPMRKGQVSPGGDWRWYPPVRMGGNQQLQGHWGMTEKGIAKLPPKEAKTPYVAPEPVLPDAIGGGWEPANDLDSPEKNPAYEKTIDGVKYKFIQSSDGSWGLVEIRNGERYGIGGQDTEVATADPAAFDDKIAQIVDAKQKLNRGALKALLTRWDFNKDVVDLISGGSVDEILAAVVADPAYADLKAKNERFMQGEQNAPYRAESNAFSKINENLGEIKDNYVSANQPSEAPAVPTNEPDVADLVDEVKGGIPTSSEIKAMMEGEGIGSQDDISGDAPSEVLPKALQEEKAVDVPADIQKAINELDAMEKAIKDALDELPLFQGEQNRVISALLAVNLAQDAKDKAIANLENRVPFVDAMDAAIWQIGSAVESLTADEIKIVELLELKDSLKKLQRQIADAKFKHLESIPKDKTPIDDVVENMLLGGEPDVAVEDLVPNAEVPIEAPVEPPAIGRGRRVRNNNVAANRRWQARFGIKPPVFYKKNRGMFYDINGVPVNVGDKVVHNNPDKNEKYGEGVIISRIPNLGRWREARGQQVKVDYASYVWVQFANGKKAKLATRMLINQNPDAVENPANVVKPVRDAEMPPPDVFIDDWKKFGKALEEFGVEPGKDARGNDGFQADAGNAQQMVISKDADGNYAVYLKEENIWRNRQVEPLFVTKNLPEAANYFIAEVHNRRYQVDFPPNPVWMGEKAPSAVPNPETNVVDVPEAGSVSNAGLPNVVNIDTNGKFEDLQKQIQDAIDNGQQIAFNYKGEDRLVTPKRIWTNPKNGNINLDAVGEDGFKVYTIVNMENADNPVEATPIPEPTPIPEDVAPEVSDKPFLEAISLEDQMANARAQWGRINEDIADKAIEGANPDDPAVVALENERVALMKKMKDLRAKIDEKNAVPSRDPQERMDALKDEYKNLGNEILDLEISTSPDQKAIDEKRNRMNDIAQEMRDVKAEINKQKSAPAPEAPVANPKAEEDKFKDFKEYVDGLVNESEFQKDYDFNNLGGDGILRVQDKKNKNQANIEWNEDAQGYQVEFRPLDLGKKEVFADIDEAGQYAMDILDKNSNKPETKLPKADSGWKSEAVEAINELFPTDVEENVLFSDNGLPEFHGGDDKNNYNDIIIELPFRGPNNHYQVVGIKQPDGTYRIFQVQYEDLGNSRWQANVIEQYLPVDNNIDLVDRMVDAYRMLEAEVNDGEDLNDFFKNDDGYYDPEGKFYQRVGGVLNENPLAEKPAEPVNFGIPEKEETAAPEAGEAPASDPSAFVGLGDALYIYDPANAEKHLRNAIADKRNVVFRYKGTDRALIPLSIWTNPKNGNVNLYAEDENGDRKNYTISKIDKVERPGDQGLPENVEVSDTPEDIPSPPKAVDIAGYVKAFAKIKKLFPKIKDAGYFEARGVRHVNRAYNELKIGNIAEAKDYLQKAKRYLPNNDSEIDQLIDILNGNDPNAALAGRWPYNGAPNNGVDVKAVAAQRIKDGANPLALNDFWREKISSGELFQEVQLKRGVDLSPYADELKAFFSDESPKPMAQLSEGARNALNLIASDALVSRNKIDNEADIQDIAKIAKAVQDERLAYEPNATSLGNAAFLVDVSLSQMEDAANGDGKLIINGKDTGFKVRESGLGGGADGENVTYFVTDTSTGRKYIYKKDSSRESIDSEIATGHALRALGALGVSWVERNNTADNILVGTFAGENMNLQDAPKNAGQAVGEYDLVNEGIPQQNLAFAVIDALILNGDRHGQNYMAAKDNKANRGNADVNQWIPFMIDNGIGRLWVDYNGMDDRPAFDFIKKGKGKSSVPRDFVKKVGYKAFYEMLQISGQQAIQEMRRNMPPGVDIEVNQLIARLEELLAHPPEDWNF